MNNIVSAMPKLWINQKVIKNKIVLYEHSEEGHSWTRNAWNAFSGMMMDCGGNNLSGLVPGSFGCRQTSGVYLYSPNDTFIKYNSNFAGVGFYNNASGNTNFGIQIGTSNQPFHLADFKLYSLISHGTGSGLMIYNAQNAPVLAYNSINKHWTTTHTRVFNNNSGGTINVREIGLVYYGTKNLNAYTLMTRDVLSETAEIPAGGQYTVEIIMIHDRSLIDTEVVPIIGELGSGGIYIGHYRYGNYTHDKYGLVLAPKSTGEASGKSWRIPSASVGVENEANSVYGANNSALLQGDANSAVGVFCANANATMLGGYNDWYIPGPLEMTQIYNNRLNLPSGEEVENANYWSSYCWAAMGQAYYRNLITNASGASSQATLLRVRLIRRIEVANWIPA